MESNQENNPNKRQGKDKGNVEQLKEYLLGLKTFPPVNEHFVIARKFNVKSFKPYFRNDAIRRFLEGVFLEPKTVATVSKLTGIEHKYLCQLKSSLESGNKLKVVHLGICPITTSKGVQFVSSNLEFNYDDNQLGLFD